MIKPVWEMTPREIVEYLYSKEAQERLRNNNTACKVMRNQLRKLQTDLKRATDLFEAVMRENA